MTNTENPNRLVNEKSPYLIKHAYNPVDWYPWGDEAFEKAQKEDKPIWLSIGYSTCHWCNVMERESYSDTEVGALMNDVFISVKVDREERPDIDNIYMAVCQLLLQSSCGWPLNIILTPDKKPFYAATYLPKTARFGRAGMVALIPRIKEIWKEDRDNAFSAANKITTALASFAGGLNGGEEELDETVFNKAFEILRDNFDEEFGGFAESPKFPTPHNLSFLLRHWRRTGNEKSLAMVEKTLQAMRRGGIYDQIGLGFHRYSTDKEWLVPHFEKMLYDQALLAIAYTEAYQATGKEFYARTAKEIFTYVLRDMTSGEGVFYSAEDADSEEEEGKFYLWTKTEIENSLEKEEARLVIKAYNIKSEGNWFDRVENKKPGTNILHLKSTPEELSAELKISEKKIELRLEKARKKLFDIRKKRIHPYKDDKTITDWNGLMIAALAKGAHVFDEPLYLSTAKRAADFILEKMRRPDGRLLHMYRKGEAGVPAMVDDYAYLTWGLLELYENSFDIKYLKEAIKLAELLVTDFWDEKNGGFFFSAKDNEKMLIPWKDFNDGSTPSGNSVAMLNLLRLGRITAIPEFEEKASEIGRAIAAFAGKAPTMHINILNAFDFGLGPSYELVIVGDKEASDTKAMLQAVRSRFIPNKVVVFRPSGKEKPEIVKIAKFTETQTSIDGKATAYVCLNYNCKLPTTDINVMLEFLDTGKNPS